MKSPAFQFYANDFLGGRVATYSLEEIGLYSVLLAFDWSLVGLPTEPEKLAKLARTSTRKFAVLWRTVGENFVERDGRYFNPRLELERTRQEDNRAKKVRAAHSRWNADTYADAEHTQCPAAEASSTSSLTEEQSSSSSADVARVLGGIPAHLRVAWEAEIAAQRQGMHGTPLTQAQIDQASRDFVGNGGLTTSSLRHFRGYLDQARHPKAPRPRAVVPFARPSKQEIARAAMAAYVERKEQEEPHGVA